MFKGSCFCQKLAADVDASLLWQIYGFREFLNIFSFHLYFRDLFKEFMTEAYDDGYHDITGVDIVEPVLETMRRRNSQRPGMKYLWAETWLSFLRKTDGEPYTLEQRHWWPGKILVHPHECPIVITTWTHRTRKCPSETTFFYTSLLVREERGQFFQELVQQHPHYGASTIGTTCVPAGLTMELPSNFQVQEKIKRRSIKFMLKCKILSQS